MLKKLLIRISLVIIYLYYFKQTHTFCEEIVSNVDESNIEHIKDDRDWFHRNVHQIADVLTVIAIALCVIGHLMGNDPPNKGS